jgi:hypothetical protein
VISALMRCPRICGITSRRWCRVAMGVVSFPILLETVKPLGLMRWLVRLVTPPGGTVLDPFAGSGTTGEAAVIEGLRCILIEKDADYVALARVRLAKPMQPGLFGDLEAS